jgi:hypothetical protein
MKFPTMRPLYAIIPYMGNEFTIVYHRHLAGDNSWLTGQRHACGQFPHTAFPDIPVIDYRPMPTENLIEFCRMNLHVLEATNPSAQVTNLKPIATFIQIVKSLGACVTLNQNPI